MDMREIVLQKKVLAILRNVPLGQASDYVSSVIRGGVDFFEVALNSRDAIEEIHLLRETFGDRAYIGAGTVISVELAKEAVAAGARFLLAPSVHEDVLCYCAEQGIELLPGVMTPSDVSLCLRYGFKTMKLFPAGSMPMGYIKALRGPFDGTEYVAIGGVDATNVEAFLRDGYAAVGIGSALCPRELVQSGDWAGCSAHIEKIMTCIQSVKGVCV